MGVRTPGHRDVDVPLQPHVLVVARRSLLVSSMSQRLLATHVDALHLGPTLSFVLRRFFPDPW